MGSNPILSNKFLYLYMFMLNKKKRLLKKKRYNKPPWRKKVNKKYKANSFFKSLTYNYFKRHIDNNIQAFLFKYKYRILLRKQKNYINFYIFYTKLEKLRIKNFLGLTIKKLKKNRINNNFFLLEQRVDIFLCRFFHKTMENIHKDILEKTITVNFKSVSPNYILKSKDFIQIFRPGFMFRKKTKNTLKKKNILYFLNDGYYFLPFFKIWGIFFIKEDLSNIKNHWIRQKWVKKAHIWQVQIEKNVIKYFFSKKKFTHFLRK